jgi:hypothetical protein
MTRWLRTDLEAKAQRKALRIASVARKGMWAWRYGSRDLLYRRMNELYAAIHDKADRL